MSAVSWDTYVDLYRASSDTNIGSRMKSLAIIALPMMVTKSLAYYRSIRSRPANAAPVRPVPIAVARTLVLLLVTSFIHLLKSLPFFAPENIFALTTSRLQIPTDVLFTRLAALRPAGLTPADELLRSRISSLDSRLLYFHHGPDAVANCAWCTPEEPSTYFYYTITALLAPHLVNAVILAIVTSGFFSGPEGARWRRTAAITAAVVAAIDAFTVNSYSAGMNARATKIEEIETFHWQMRALRCVVLAVLDAIMGLIIYTAATNRAFVSPPDVRARIESTTRTVDVLAKRLNAVAILRNTVARDADLRSRSAMYWVREGAVMSEAMEERDVVEGLRRAVAERIDLSVVERDAELYSQGVIAPLLDPSLVSS